MPASLGSPLSSDDLRKVAQLFSRPVFATLGQGRLPTFARGARQLLCGAAATTVAEVLDRGYGALVRQYRAEYVYKNELASKIVFSRHSPRTASLVSELRTGGSILDVAVFNGTSTAYEIKTEYDTLARLPDQLRDYLRVFDKVFVVTYAAAVDSVLKVIPQDVGLMVLTTRGALSTVREATSNIARLDLDCMFNVLRRSEYLRILERTHQWQADVPRGYLFAEAKRRFCELEPEVAHAEAVSELRLRTTDDATVNFVRSLPSSVRTLGLSEPLSGIGQQRLTAALQQTI